LLRQLSGQFRSLEARQEVDITWRIANVSFPDAWRFVRAKKLRPSRLQLSKRLLLIRNASFDRFVLTSTQVECLGAIEAASARDIEFRHAVRPRYDELSAQRDHRKWNQHFILRDK
jgi:hypothetical protein